MQHSSLPWWRTETYDEDGGVPDILDAWAGPKGPALVRVWPDGRTDPGWGLNPPKGSSQGFMPRYLSGQFNARRVLFGYNRSKWSFAFVMRSLQLVAIDIDGKNGGLEHAKQLGPLPPTLAETSKSGNGYHLFYVVDEPWDPEKGFGLLNDRIGIEQGVDFRATGCVYHHSPQRWNHRTPAMLPQFLQELVQKRDHQIEATHARIRSVLANNDDLEVLLMHDDIVSQLNKKIPEGKRNQTLFAIGSQMCQAQVPSWEQLLTDRAIDLGLPGEEIDKLVRNIGQYGLTAVAP